MKIHYLQHVPFEGLGSIETVLQERGHSISLSRMFENDPFPRVSGIDWLIVMGGPMGVWDESEFPWLGREKQYMKDIIEAGKVVIGICLGAQLVAEVMGAKVYKNNYREIGWFDIYPNPRISNTILKEIFSQKIEVFHWHGDTFDIPDGAIPIASSQATQNQGFVFDNRVIALQFHLETTPESAKALIENCRNDLDSSKYVQNKQEIMSNLKRFNAINHLMHQTIKVLDSYSTK